MIEELKIKTEAYYSIQKQRIQTQLRIKSYVRNGKLERDQAAELHGWMDELLFRIEKKIKRDVEKLLKNVPIWQEFLKQVNGVGPCLAGSLIAGIVDIGRFRYVSSLWKYCGMHVVNGHAPQKTRGQKIDWNPFLRMTCYKIGESFVKQKADNCLYRRLYTSKKKYYRTKHPEKVAFKTKKGKTAYKYTDGHIHAMARRYAVKIFLSHLWVRWREIEGLPITKPWVFEHRPGHRDYIAPQEAMWADWFKKKAKMGYKDWQ